MGRYVVVTTFNQSGLELYAQRFIDTFDQNMPEDVDLLLYAENCSPKVPRSSQRDIRVVEVQKTLDKLMRFKAKYATDPRALDFEYVRQYLSKRRQVSEESYYKKLSWASRLQHNMKQMFHRLNFHLAGKRHKQKYDGFEVTEFNRFLWDFVRFSHKVYSVVDASRRVNSEILIWMDADSVVHSKVPIKFLDDLIDDRYFMCYLGRKHFHSECGWYSMRLSHQHADAFFNEFERMYEQAERGFFLLDEWHDSYVWDHVRLWHERKYGTVNKSISGQGYFTHHPLVNSCLGQYFDHLKGARKSEKRSSQKDLMV